MLVNVHHGSRAEHRRLLVAGVAFLSTIALLIGLSIAIYDKKFQRVTTVRIEAARAGLQLPRFGDVRSHGVLVGQVREVEAEGDHAVITVTLDPDLAQGIPANADVEILPTTLFGQKYVSFLDPAAPADEPLRDGAVIPMERVDTNVELSQVLARLFPLLRTVQPAELNYTLSALADALRGRGDQLGDTLERLDGYLRQVDGSLPRLREDLVALAQVADAYDDAAPDLLDALADLTVTSKTVVEKKADLATFFGDLTDLSDTSTRVIGDNGADLVRMGQVTAPVMRLLAVYSPEFPCLIRGAANYNPRLGAAFSGGKVKQYLEFGTAQYRHYDERDKPVYGEVGHGPWCLGLPDPPFPIGPQPLRDGTDLDDNPPTSPVPNSGGQSGGDGFGAFGVSPTSDQQGVASGYAGTPADQYVVNALLAGRSGRPADSYGALGSLLYGPVLRGSARTGQAVGS